MTIPGTTVEDLAAGGPAGRGEALDPRQLADQVRTLSERIVRPSAADRDRGRRWDPALFRGFSLDGSGAGPGLTGALVPRDLGGAGLTGTQTCAALDALGEGSRDPGFALALAVHAVLVTMPVRVLGNGFLRGCYLPRMASGQWPGGLSLRQTQGASSSPTVSVCSGPGGWVLDGELDLVVLGPVARHFLVIAAHEDGARTAFLVDRDTAGLSASGDVPPAMASCPWGRLVFERCEVPAERVLGSVGGAAAEVEPLLAVLDWVFTAAPWLGLMRVLAAAAGEHARTALLFGRPLLSSQSTRFALADLAVRRELAEGMLYRAASGFDGGGRPALADAAAARLFVAQAAADVAEAAIGMAGPSASLVPGDDGLAARVARDASFLTRSGGGTEVLRPVIAASLLDLG